MLQVWPRKKKNEVGPEQVGLNTQWRAVRHTPPKRPGVRELQKTHTEGLEGGLAPPEAHHLSSSLDPDNTPGRLPWV